MSHDPNNFKTQGNTVYNSSKSVDKGLQAHMHKVYHLMTFGLGITGITAFAISSMPALFNAIFTSPLAFVVMFAPLAFLWFGFTPNKIAKYPASKLQSTFFIFSAIMGVSMATIFIVFTSASIARVFFITAATFTATSLYGYVTKKDLSGFHSFLFMGLIGIIIASIVNIFIHSEMIHFIVSIVGVLVFTGLTAFETQRMKQMYRAGQDEANSKLAIVGALGLYLNFINLFQILLNIMGDRR